MKILIVSQYYYPEPFSVTKIAEELIKRGHDITVLTSKPNYGYHKIIPGYEKINFEIINGVKIHRVNTYPRKESKISIVRNYLSYWAKAKTKVNRLKEDFDLVFSFSLSPVISIAPAAKYSKKHHKKHVLYCFDIWPESVVATGMIKKDTIMYSLIKSWSKSLYKTADKILISSPSFKSYFKDVIGINEEKCQYIFQPSVMEGFSKNNELVLDNNFFNIVYCGNLGEVQNLDLIIDAMRSIKERVRFNIIGLGSDKNRFLSKVKEEGLSESIVYLGAMPAEKAAKYLNCANALYLSLDDSTIIGKTIPNKLSMYMQFSKPIIASLSGDAKDLLNDAGGSIVTGNSSFEVENAIKKLLSLSKHERDEMGQKNIEYYYKYLSVERIINQIEQVLLETIKK